MTDEQEPRDHHYVPRLYLKGFTGDDGMMTVVNRKWGTIKRKSPRAVFFQRDYYRVEDGEDGRPTAFEDAFAELENRAAPVLQRIIATGTLPSAESSEYALLMNFVALQAMRGPHARRRLDEPRHAFEKLLEHQKQLQEAFGRPGDPPNPKVEALQRWVEDEPTTRDHVEALITAATAVLQPLAERNWSLIRAGEGALFITSDQPVSLRWSDPADEQGFYGPGFRVGGTDVTIPLSPDLLLFGRFESVPPSGTSLPRRKVALVNTYSLVHAVRYAASQTEDLVVLLNGEVRGTEDLASLWRENPVSPEEDLDAKS